jgi:methyltransferase (TIGR00027 family)
MQVSNQLPVKHVSHTAWLVAAFRAQESERPDAHFKDNLASKLLGALETEYLSRFSEDAKTDHWLLTIRTCQIDQLILNAVQNGVTTILNLGAGLDTRPYRLPLPSSVNWYEADFPELIDYKNKTLIQDVPHCNLHRISADLSDAEQRRKVLRDIDGLSASTLVLTEGLLYYLTDQNVAELANELAETKSFNYWLMDIFNHSFIDVAHKLWNITPADLESDDVRFHFLPENMESFLKPLGWDLKQLLSFGQGAIDLDRFPKGYDLQKVESEKGLFESGVCLFTKSRR